MIGVGLATAVIGLFFEAERVWLNLLLGSYALVTLGLFGIFLVAIQYATSASWGVVIRRIAEAMSSAVPVGAIGIILILLIHPSTYPWHSAVELTGFKGMWLDLPFLMTRAGFYILIWLVFTYAIIKNSRQQDSDGDEKHYHNNVKLSAIFIILFSITFWLASFDWVMSLEPFWYSTIFGVYNFAGLFAGGLAALIVLIVWLQRQGILEKEITADHLHDLGKLLMGFTVFWWYTWFCQYMLIWYANIPEETVYFIPRLEGTWGVLFLVNMLLNWGVPFLLLLPRKAKRNPVTMVRISLVVLLGRWLDLYLMILPARESSHVSWYILLDAGIIVGVAGLFIFTVLRSFKKVPALPVNDPYLAESLHFHQ